MNTKACIKCGKELPATTEYFGKDIRVKSGLKSRCKECLRIEAKEYKKNNNHIHKQYYLDNKDSLLVRSKQNREKNKERLKELKDKYREENKEKIKISKKKYRQENKELVNIAKQKREARKKQLNATLTMEQWEHIKSKFNNQCAYCGMTEEESLQEYGQILHQEHFIALSKGGEYTKENIIPACRSCNGSKSDSDFFEWYPKQESYGQEREEFILNHLGYDEILEERIG